MRALVIGYLVITGVILFMNRRFVLAVWKIALFGERGRRLPYFLTAMKQLAWPLIIIEKIIRRKG